MSQKPNDAGQAKPQYFLTVRFPLNVVWSNPSERRTDPPPSHEKYEHVFYVTDSRVVAEKLVELLGHDEVIDYHLELCQCDGDISDELGLPDFCESPILEIFNGENLEFAQRMEYWEALEGMGSGVVELWKLQWPGDREILVAFYRERAAGLEAPIREALGLGAASTHPDAQRHLAGKDDRPPDSAPARRCAPMTKTEIARRILNVCSGPVRPRKVETKLAKCQLRDEDDGLWSIVLDPRFLDQNMIDRLLLPADAWPPSDVMPTTK